MATQAVLAGRVVLLLLGGVTAGVVGWRAMQPGAPEEPLPAAEVAGAAVPEGTAPTPEEENTVAATPVPEPAAEEVAAAEPAPEVVPDPVPEAAVEPEPEPVPEPEPEPAPEAMPTPEPEPAPAAPEFDVVRIEPDGAALIAGTAPPDAQVSLQLDGVEEMRVQADADGKFVALFTLAPNPAPRLLSLMAILDDGSDLPGAATVAIAPITATVPVASAEAVPEPAPEAMAEPAPPATLLVTEEGAEVIRSPVAVPAGETVPVSLDAIAYAPDGAVQLSGRGAAGQGLLVYLDNVATMDASVAQDGTWAVTLPETAPGIYTMRIDQIAADGAVSARFETPFKRETPEALALAAAPPAAPEPVAEPAPEPVAETAPEPVAEPEAVVEPAPLPEPVAEPAEPIATEEPAASVPAEPAVAVAPEVAPVPEPEVVAEHVAAVAPVTITVQPGFTLWGIATDMMGEGTMYVQVFEANKDKIRDPDLIYPGQVFTLPQE